MIVYRLFHPCNPDARQNTENRKHLSSNEAEAREIPDRLEKLTDSMPRREQKTASDEIKRVLALFFTPALVKQGDGCKIFAETFCGMWNKRYPRNTFQAASVSLRFLTFLRAQALISPVKSMVMSEASIHDLN